MCRATRSCAYAEREGAISFDAPGARYTHRGNMCSFETLIEEYRIDDPAVAIMARVVHGADVSEDIAITPESAGLMAIADGFALLDLDDQTPAGPGAARLRRPLRLGPGAGRPHRPAGLGLGASWSAIEAKGDGAAKTAQTRIHVAFGSRASIDRVTTAELDSSRATDLPENAVVLTEPRRPGDRQTVHDG